MSTLKNPLQGRVAVVTGAASGIGRAIVSALSLQDVTVHALIRGAVPALALSNDSSINWHHVDLANDLAITEFAARPEFDDPGIDFLIHSAGLFRSAPVTDSAVGELDEIWRVNARAPYLLTQRLLSGLIRKKGFIAFINSSVWLNPKRELAGYTMSKYALKALADTLRSELNVHDVRVLSIFPGKTATPMQEGIYKARSAFYEPDVLLQPESIATTLIDALAMPESCEITDIFVRPSRPS